MPASSRPSRASSTGARSSPASSSSPSRVYGPVIGSGLAWLSGSEGNYWGHNAIVRREAFTEAAGLPHLSGKPPFGGHILSHDFVEAALIRRAGWTVKIADDLGGSYEESPPSLIDLAIRDSRWCQGNLQHSRIVRRARAALDEPLPPRRRHPLLPRLAAAGCSSSSPAWRWRSRRSSSVRNISRRPISSSRPGRRSIPSSSFASSASPDSSSSVQSSSACS